MVNWHLTCVEIYFSDFTILNRIGDLRWSGIFRTECLNDLLDTYEKTNWSADAAKSDQEDMNHPPFSADFALVRRIVHCDWDNEGERCASEWAYQVDKQAEFGHYSS